MTTQPTTPDQATIEAQADAYARNTISPAFADALLRGSAKGSTPDPEWLPELRAGMRTEINHVTDPMDVTADEAAVITDVAIGLAASYLHPLHQLLDVKDEVIQARDAALAGARARIDDLERGHRPATATAATYLGAASPEMREVPDRKFEAGDTITVTALAGPQTSWSRGATKGVMWKDIDLLTEIHLRDLAEPAVVTVTRPASPLPDKPGAVGTATVSRLGRVQVHLLDAGSSLPWVAMTDNGPVWLAESHLSDYAPLLDGSDL